MRGKETLVKTRDRETVREKERDPRTKRDSEKETHTK